MTHKCKSYQKVGKWPKSQDDPIPTLWYADAYSWLNSASKAKKKKGLSVSFEMLIQKSIIFIQTRLKS